MFEFSHGCASRMMRGAERMAAKEKQALVETIEELVDITDQKIRLAIIARRCLPRWNRPLPIVGRWPMPFQDPLSP